MDNHLWILFKIQSGLVGTVQLFQINTSEGRISPTCVSSCQVLVAIPIVDTSGMIVVLLFLGPTKGDEEECEGSALLLDPKIR